MEKNILPEERQGEALKLDFLLEKKEAKKLFVESYGCQMNFSDSEIVAAIMLENGYTLTQDYTIADAIFLNTCAIRENAELRIRKRLTEFRETKRNNPGLIVGVMGCMAERLKTKLLEEEKLVDVVVGPDAYRDLPQLMATVESGQKAINVILSKDETYADISPVRLSSNGVTAFVSITRGCDNMCAFCVVPFTRGRERSRDPESIVQEATQLFQQGYREVTLLGQNVDSYYWAGGGLKKDNYTPEEQSKAVKFYHLLEMVAQINPLLRVRFSTSHPKDMTDEVFETMVKYHNICKYVHLPVQSGNTEILEKMNRGYTREWYLDRIASMRSYMPEINISTDFITGFCSETEAQHQDTLSLIKEVGYDFAYMFTYSERPKTLAERKYKDDVPEDVKNRRLNEIIVLQRANALKSNQKDVGKVFEVLIEGTSKKSQEQLFGRTSASKVVVFPKGNLKKGMYIQAKINDCTSGTLIGEVLEVQHQL